MSVPSLTVRRPLAGAVARGRLLRAARGWLERRVILLGALLVGLCLVHVWLGLRVMHLGYEVSLARQMQLRLEHEQRELEVELATRRDPARIAEAARTRLGMTEPRKGQVVYLP
jgi:cell division protein FtsL